MKPTRTQSSRSQSARTLAGLTAAALAATALAGCATRPATTAAAGPAQTAAPPAAEAPATPYAAQDIDRDGLAAPSLQAAFADAAGGDRVFFALDRHDLSDDARATLRRQARWLAQNPQVRILIAGNCDERGTREYNFALGARRAEAALRFLAAEGVSTARMRTVSYGKEKPLDPAAGDAAWSRNRNGHTVLLDAGP